MEVLATLNAEEALATRNLEAAELRAKNKMHEFKAFVEVQYNALQQEAQAKSNATIAHLQGLAKKYELDADKIGFDFENLAFVPKQ